MVHIEIQPGGFFLKHLQVFSETFAMQHSRRDRPSGLSVRQGTNLKVCPYNRVSDSGVFEGIFV